MVFKNCVSENQLSS